MESLGAVPLLARRILLLATASAVAGCGADAKREQPTRTVIACDPVSTGPSLASLRRRASGVILLRASGSRAVRRIGGVPVTISPAEVLRQLAGQRVPAHLALRETGAAGATGCETPIARGSVYIAYVTAFWLRSGGPPVGDQYVALALFRHRGRAAPADSEASFRRIASGLPAPPGRISIAQARRR